MRLVMDLQGMQNESSRNRGIGRYVRSLATSLLRNKGRHQLEFILSAQFPDHIAEDIASFEGLASPSQFHLFHAPGPTRALQVENRWRAAVSHQLYHKFVDDLAPDALLIGSLFEGGGDNSITAVPPTPQQYLTAAILFDLIPLLEPDRHIGSAEAKQWYFDKIEQAKRTDLMLAISQSARSDGIIHLPSCENHVRFMGAAVDSEFSDTSFQHLRNTPVSRDVLDYYEINRPFVMHASAFDPRKNFEGLIAAFSRLPQDLRKAHQLVLVCKLNPAGHAKLLSAIKAANLGPDEVVLTGYVPDADLRILYANCKLFAFPSFSEGFGLPVIEAMCCGAPAIGSNLSSVPEVIGREDAIFDPYDLDQITAPLGRALSDEQWRQELTAHGKAFSRTFNWDDVAQRAISEISLALEKRVRAPASQPEDESIFLERLARTPAWPGPTDADLLATAQAIAANEHSIRTAREYRVSGIHKVNSL